jgi:uncharacterized membrane protein
MRRILAILALRLAALAVAVTLVLRPSLATYKDDDALPSKLILLVDASSSMEFRDEFNSLSRWENALRILNSATATATLKELTGRHKVEVLFYQGAEHVTKFNASGKASGQRTDMGTWLNELLQHHGRATDVRALALFSDGADNGAAFPTLDKAALWRGVAPLHTFAAGRPTSALDQGDLAFVDISAEPAPVPVKGKLTIKGVIDAPKFVNNLAKFSLFVDGKPAFPEPVKQVQLTKDRGNVIAMTCDAPNKPGEIKVTMKVDTQPNEVTDFNNEISTYVNVTKEGVSVLWVEGKKRAFESVFAIRHALARDPRFRVFYTERLREAGPAEQRDDWFNFDKQHYDVVVIGDISAERFTGGDPRVFKQIQDLVQKGGGLLMLGGYETFGGDWRDTRFGDWAALLPVTMNRPGQVEGQVRVIPTTEGKSHYLLRLADDPKKNDEIWEKFEPLDGMSQLGDAKPTSPVFATRDGGEPILVGGAVGEGRVLAFGGDTTWKAWRRSEETLPAYERFWKQTMLWLARQEEVEGNVWVKPDRRRLAADGNQRLGFSVGIQGKGGIKVKEARITAKVIQPDKEEINITLLPEAGDIRGYVAPRLPGEYLIEVSGEGKDADGSVVRGSAKSRFLAFAEDLEKLRPAADHDFLARLAATGGGKAHLADEKAFGDFLQTLAVAQKTDAVARPELWPNWRQNPTSKTPWDQIAALWNSAALLCFLAFTFLLCLEWFLRRRWGLV